jgi:hypothetical protein
MFLKCNSIRTWHIMKQGEHQLKTKGNLYKFLCFALFNTNKTNIIFTLVIVDEFIFW